MCLMRYVNDGKLVKCVICHTYPAGKPISSSTPQAGLQRLRRIDLYRSTLFLKIFVQMINADPIVFLAGHLYLSLHKHVSLRYVPVLLPLRSKNN